MDLKIKPLVVKRPNQPKSKYKSNPDVVTKIKTE